MKIGIVSLGCAKNLVDSEYLMGLFLDPYFKYEKDPNKCDAIIINTCGFIESAKTESINAILEYSKLKKKKLKYLIVTGCLSQRYYNDLKKELVEVDLFIKISDYDKANSLLSDLFNHEIKTIFGCKRKLINMNHSAYLRISDGCSNRCAYCAIPLIRGDNKSIPIDVLYNEAKRLHRQGVKELNVVAQDTTNYGLDLYKKLSLSKLLKKLDTISFKWIRVLYMYPDEITDDLLNTIKRSKRIIPYFDIPIQYADDDVLMRMNRRGNVKSIRKVINKIRSKFDNPIIRTTIMVGFPFEDKDTFNNTLDFIKEIEFDSLGCFVYSREENTRAYYFDRRVRRDVAMRRYEELMLVQKTIVNKKMQSKIGNVYTIVVDKYDSSEKINYCRNYESAPDDVDYYILIPGKKLSIGSFYKAKITHYYDYDFIGKIIK